MGTSQRRAPAQLQEQLEHPSTAAWEWPSSPLPFLPSTRSISTCPVSGLGDKQPPASLLGCPTATAATPKPAPCSQTQPHAGLSWRNPNQNHPGVCRDPVHSNTQQKNPYQPTPTSRPSSLLASSPAPSQGLNPAVAQPRLAPTHGWGPTRALSSCTCYPGSPWGQYPTGAITRPDPPWLWLPPLSPAELGSGLASGTWRWLWQSRNEQERGFAKSLAASEPCWCGGKMGFPSLSPPGQGLAGCVAALRPGRTPCLSFPALNRE